MKRISFIKVSLLAITMLVLPQYSYAQTNGEISSIRAPRPDAPHNQDGSPVGSLLTCDQQEVLGLLNNLKNDINNCCIILQEDFNGTFTSLTDLQEIFTTCCSTIQNDIKGTFTVLSDILNTLTQCCAEITSEFNQTWTILAAGFSNTFTAIFDFNATLTTCCNQIEENFENLFVALENLSFICSGSNCNAIAITTPITITSPGSYCLANDIVGSIIINASNVTVDLNQHTIVGLGMGGGDGITANGGSNIVIKNGRIINVDTAIVSNTNSNIILENIVVETAFTEGITINNGTNIQLDSLVTTSILGIGVHFTGNNNTALINNVTIILAEQGFVFDTITNSLIQNCNVLDCSNPTFLPIGTATGGFVIINGSFLQFVNCSVKNYIAVDGASGFSLSNVNNVIFQKCTVQNVITTLSQDFASIAVGFDCGVNTDLIQFTECSVLDVAADLTAIGFLINGTNIILETCIASHFTTVTIPPSSGINVGFQVESNNVFLKNCEAYECPQSGFLISPTHDPFIISLLNCTAAYNTNGFNIGSINASFEQCLAFKNSVGFNAALVGLISLTKCFSTQNTTNYSFVPNPNVQNANTQVNNTAPGLTGPFAGGNLFI